MIKEICTRINVEQRARVEASSHIALHYRNGKYQPQKTDVGDKGTFMTEPVGNSTLETWIRENEKALMDQSRSFAIPILNLDERFIIPVMVEYNLNKTIDTIEDSINISVNEKVDLIKTFCGHLRQDSISFEVKKRMMEVTPEEEASVFRYHESIIGLFNSLSLEEKGLIKRWTREMAKGMCLFLTRPINSPKDLNDYCYYVAGTVGIFLTNLLRLKGSNITEKVFKKLKESAVSFGLFLQKLNVMRDFVEDKDIKKRSFWPQSYFEQEKDRLIILNRMCSETFKNDVPHAVEYFKQIPAGNDSFDCFIRFLLSSGMEYLRILKNNDSVFSPGTVKLPRAFIENLYAKVSSQPREQFKDYCEQFHAEEMKYYNKKTWIKRPPP